MTIKVEDVEKAVDWLRDNAQAAAQARAERIYMEAFVKTVLAEEMKQYADTPIAAQEREARCSARYLSTLQALRDAVKADETHRFLRDAASAKIEAWRTLEATRRAEERAYQ